MLLAFCVALATSVQSPQDAIDVLEVRIRVLTLRNGILKEDVDKAIQPKANAVRLGVMANADGKPELMSVHYQVGSKCGLQLWFLAGGTGASERWILHGGVFCSQ